MLLHCLLQDAEQRAATAESELPAAHARAEQVHELAAATEARCERLRAENMELRDQLQLALVQLAEIPDLTLHPIVRAGMQLKQDLNMGSEDVHGRVYGEASDAAAASSLHFHGAQTAQQKFVQLQTPATRKVQPHWASLPGWSERGAESQATGMEGSCDASSDGPGHGQLRHGMASPPNLDRYLEGNAVLLHEYRYNCSPDNLSACMQLYMYGRDA